ncbi:MAG: hypothetical protein OXB92_13965 [Acidimicrobiaceae bacterium]|nr:hypothetical protein [Acidimicrobiia bacterium]MCY4494954.1 hypothetical protein [Acidimicrobiaceae bacterium]
MPPPESKERDSADAPALAVSWEPIVEAALARRGADPEPVADDYRIKAIPKQIVVAGLGDTFGVTQEMLDEAARSQALGEPRGQGGILDRHQVSAEVPGHLVVDTCSIHAFEAATSSSTVSRCSRHGVGFEIGTPVDAGIVALVAEGFLPVAGEVVVDRA